MKTHAEFLEELKPYIADQIGYLSGYLPNYSGIDGVKVANDILVKIEQFETQLKGNKGDESDKR